MGAVDLCRRRVVTAMQAPVANKKPDETAVSALMLVPTAQWNTGAYTSCYDAIMHSSFATVS
jgi:hypothetical protein